MNGLAAQQGALLQALWARQADRAGALLAPHLAGSGGPLPMRGLQAYRSNGRELAQRALAAAYPVVFALIGEEAFAALARELWLAHPPQRGDLAQWGGDLARQIDELPSLREEEPYLSDVARAEWALHRAATAADEAQDAASLPLLAQREPEALCLRLAPGLAVVHSAWPIASIVLAHLEGEPALEEAGRRLRARQAESALVWRQGLRPRLRALAAGEGAFIASLQEGGSLADALQAAPGLAFDAWLAPAWHDGLLLGAAPLMENRT